MLSWHSPKCAAVSPSMTVPSLSVRLPFLLLFLFLLHSDLAQQQPRQSCREHLLNGHSRDGVFPLVLAGHRVFWLECRFPPPSGQSARLSVQTVLNNALVGHWLRAADTVAVGPDIFVRQQVADGELLRTILADSEQCSQQIRVRWPRPRKEDNQSVIAETMDGQLLEIVRNRTGQSKKVRVGPIPAGQTEEEEQEEEEEEMVSVPSKGGPVVRLRAPLPPGVSLSLSALVCRQMIVPRADCHFQLFSDSDRLRVNLAFLRRKFPREQTLSWAFRTSKPNEMLLELVDIDGDKPPLGVLELVDGYLLLANRISHSAAKLVADGQWHSLHLDLHSMSVRVDGLGTAVSLRTTPDARAQALDIRVNGELAALRLGGDKNGQWICAEQSDLLIIPNNNSPQHILNQSPVCPPTEKSFCNCKGPNSALLGGTFGRQSAQCSPPEPQRAFRLSRLASQLSFFLISNFSGRSDLSISVLFKTEKETGLVLFGVYSSSARANGRANHPPHVGAESGGRVQVHFVAQTMFAAFCSKLADDSERCQSCAVSRKDARAFSSADQWTRVSLFQQMNSLFLAVDHQICELSPNGQAVDPAELYRIQAKNVLLVGGTFYAKEDELRGRVSEQFWNDFQEKTREKAPSLQGCVAEIVLRGQRLSLADLFSAQQQRAASGGEGVQPAEEETRKAVFAMAQGCPDCPAQCQGAPCQRPLSPSAPPVCLCASVYARSVAGGCLPNGDRRDGLWLGSAPNSPPPGTGDNDSQAASIFVPIQGPTPQKGQPRLRLDRLWLLFRPPEGNHQMRPFLRIGGLELSAAENGARMAVEAKEYGLREEFVLAAPRDSRLHLFALERQPTVGTAAQSLILRMDSQRRRVHLDEFPLAGGGDAGESVELLWKRGEEDRGQTEESILANSAEGCIQELVFHYAQTDEQPSGRRGAARETEQIQQQLDFVDLLLRGSGGVSLLPRRPSSRSPCGWRDSSLWLTNSTSFGRLSALSWDDSAEDGIGAILLLDGGASLGRLSLLLTVALSMLVLVALVLFLLSARRNGGEEKTEGHCCTWPGQNHGRLLDAAEQEKRPLKLVMEDEAGSNGKVPRNEYDEFPPPRPARSPLAGKGNRQMDNGISVEQGAYEEIGSGETETQNKDVNGIQNGLAGLRVTPLRQQPMRRPHSQSPLAVQKAHFLASSPQPPPRGWPPSPGPSRPPPFDSSISPSPLPAPAAPLLLVRATSRQQQLGSGQWPSSASSAPIACQEQL